MEKVRITTPELVKMTGVGGSTYKMYPQVDGEDECLATLHFEFGIPGRDKNDPKDWPAQRVFLVSSQNPEALRYFERSSNEVLHHIDRMQRQKKAEAKNPSSFWEALASIFTGDERSRLRNEYIDLCKRLSNDWVTFKTAWDT